MGLTADYGFGPKRPPLEQVLSKLVSQTYKERGINLFEANAYRYFVSREIIEPEIIVQDGRVPSQTKGEIVVDFYKVKPKKDKKKTK